MKLVRGRGGFYRDNQGRALVAQDDGTRIPYHAASKLGDWIDDNTNLVKWQQRQLIEGLVNHAHANQTTGLETISKWLGDLDQLHGQDRKHHLDSIVKLLHEAAGTDRKADRGTETHTVTEHADRGYDWLQRAQEAVELDVDTQRRLVEAWDHCLDAHGLEVVEIERACVNDHWRTAGTLDRILRPTRPIEVQGHVIDEDIVADAKTSALWTTKEGEIRYWAKYPIQLACYGLSVPYDPETETRGEWDRPPSQQHGLIIHLDVDKAARGAADIATVIHVNLVEGRFAAEACITAANRAERYAEGSGVFTPINPQPQPDPQPEVDRRERLLARYHNLNDEGKAAFRAIPVDKDNLDRIEQVIDQIESGWNPKPELARQGLTEA